VNCHVCGGEHWGSYKCPYIEAPCVVCGTPTIVACADCGINSGGKESVHVCDKSECRHTHERLVHPPKELAAGPLDAQTKIGRLVITDEYIDPPSDVQLKLRAWLRDERRKIGRKRTAVDCARSATLGAVLRKLDQLEGGDGS